MNWSLQHAIKHFQYSAETPGYTGGVTWTVTSVVVADKSCNATAAYFTFSTSGTGNLNAFLSTSKVNFE
jgi:hypothetical protein